MREGENGKTYILIYIRGRVNQSKPNIWIYIRGRVNQSKPNIWIYIRGRVNQSKPNIWIPYVTKELVPNNHHQPKCKKMIN